MRYSGDPTLGRLYMNSCPVPPAPRELSDSPWQKWANDLVKLWRAYDSELGYDDFHASMSHTAGLVNDAAELWMSFVDIDSS